MKYRNLLELFLKRADKYAKRVLMRYKKRSGTPFEDISWQETKDTIARLSLGLRQLGIRSQENIGLLSATCQHWLPCDFAIMSLGAVTVPLYHSSTSESIAYIAVHAQLKVIIVRDKIQLQKIRSVWQQLPNLQYVIVMENKGDLPENEPRILTLESVIKIGEQEYLRTPNFLYEQAESIDIESIASVIYTSGTTGEPKGAVLTHKNFLVAALSFYEYVPLEEGYSVLSFLPLAHIFERVTSEIYGIDQGVVFNYCEKIEDLPEMLIESKCNLMDVVPRILEKIHDRIINKANQQSFTKQVLFNTALKIGIEYAKKKVAREKISWELELRYSLAYKTVLSKVKEKIAPNLKIFVVGGAPFSVDLAYFYMALGFTVIEGYGLTETSAPISVNPPWANKPGTVGLPFKHFEVKISDDGEILCRGESLFKGYYKSPESTAEAIIDGWFHTGDLGSFDEEGYLKITGRKKDLIITAGGKNVSPTRVEEVLLASKFLSQVVILGDQEKYLAALVVIDETEVRRWLKEKNITLDSQVKIYQEPQVIQLIEDEIKLYSNNLASFEQVKAFHILREELTIDNGELTPTLKIKRNFIRQKYRDVIKPLFLKSKK